nr:uncharacterized protein LOC115256818 [Aedes albopictus]
MTSDVEDLITGLRCDVSLPEKKVQVFIDTISSVLSWTQRYTMSVIKSYIETKQLSLEDDDTLELLNAVHIPNIVSTVRTHKSNVSNLEVKAGCTIPEPVEHVLGRTKTIHRVLLLPTRGKKFQNLVKQNQVSKKVRLQKDVYHYIPIIDTLRLIMTNPGAREMIESEARQFDDTIRTFKDGHQFTLHAFLNDHPCALRLSFHIDEGEYADALGSRKGKNKLTNVCIKIQNIDARINSSLDRVYIALMVKSSVLKKYGYRKVFQPLIEDLLKLESKEGVKLKTAAGIYTLRATLVNALGDTLAVHELYGLLGPSANYFCRSCMITRRDLHNGNFGDNFPHRTVQSVQIDLETIQQNEKLISQCGIKEECVLHELGYFRWPNNHVFDPMHDLFEGILPMIIKKC